MVFFDLKAENVTQLSLFADEKLDLKKNKKTKDSDKTSSWMIIKGFFKYKMCDLLL